MPRKPDSYPWSVHLSAWAGQNGHHRLYGAITFWWAVVRWYKQKILWPFQWNVWLPFRMKFMKKCPKHPRMVMTYDLCIWCEMSRARRLRELKP